LALLFGLASAIGAAGSMLRLRQAWVAVLGRHSLEIYLLHILVGSGVRIVLQNFMGVTNPIVHLVVGTLLGLGALLAVTIKKLGANWLFAALDSAPERVKRAPSNV